jgi:cytochrome P450
MTTDLGNGDASAGKQSAVADFEFPSPAITRDPFPFYAALRDQSPVYKYPGRDEFFVAKREDIAFVLQNPDIFSNELYKADPRFVQTPEWIADPPPMPTSAIKTPFSMGMSDPPEHMVKQTSIRPMVAARRLLHYEPAVIEACDLLIDAFATRGTADLRTEYADPLAVWTICEIAGFPQEDREIFLNWTRITNVHGRQYLSDSELERIDRDVPEQKAYCETLLRERYANPTDDYISAMIRRQIDRDGALNMPYLTTELNVILTAGNETTSRLVTSTAMLLLQHPDQLAEVRRDPTLLTNAIEETLRFESPTQWISRLVKEDTEIGGVPIPRGAFVMVLLGSANRDEFWEGADRFDVTRTDVRTAHFAFGGGEHRCPGAPVARFEAEIALARLLARLDNLQLMAGHDADLDNIDNFQKRVPKALHVTFDAAPR